MNTPNFDAGRLGRRVRPVDREKRPGIHGFCPFLFIRRNTRSYAIAPLVIYFLIAYLSIPLVPCYGIDQCTSLYSSRTLLSFHISGSHIVLLVSLVHRMLLWAVVRIQDRRLRLNWHPLLCWCLWKP